jgi:uncharacterized protein YcfJ
MKGTLGWLRSSLRQRTDIESLRRVNMRPYILAAGLAAAALTTTAPANAQQRVVCKTDGNGRLAATVVGAGIGAILGRVVTGRHGGTAGALVGGGVGGLAGNQLAKTDNDNCRQAYGYYDDQNRWHANAIAANEARGFYDRDGNWVDGAPNGYYDSSNRWVALQGDSNYAGYRDKNGRYVPVTARGYYANDGQWIDAAAPGYYDRNGRWIAGPATGYYDANGRWMTGTSVAYRETQPGYWDNGRWVRGDVRGYYDSRGRWISTAATGGTVTTASYENARTRPVAERIDRMEGRIQRNADRGVISRSEAMAARDELRRISKENTRLRVNGRLSARDEDYIQQRLDRLSESVHAEINDTDRRPG